MIKEALQMIITDKLFEEILSIRDSAVVNYES